MQNINRKEASYSSTSFLLCFVQRLLNYYPNCFTRRLYVGEVLTPYLYEPQSPVTLIGARFKLARDEFEEKPPVLAVQLAA